MAENPDRPSAALVVESPFSAIYTMEGLSAELRQGEILTDIYEAQYDQEVDDFVEVKRDFVIIATQDCDLLQDYNRMNEQKEPQLLGVLLYEAKDASSARNAAPSSAIWKQTSQNKTERFHLLEEVDSPCDLLHTGMSALVVDFKRVFTLPYKEIRRQLEGRARRRTRLASPYLEHFSVRLGYYNQRVALPHQHSWPRDEKKIP